MSSSMISLKGVSFRYQGMKRKALQDISLEVARGEFLAVTGASGAGKSTLCQMLNGIIPSFVKGEAEGELLVAGLDPRKTPVCDMAEQVGLVFQDPDTQLFGMTVEEDIGFGPSNLGYDYQACMERIRRSLADLGIESLRERNPQDLSGGQKQAVAIAGVYAMLPQLMVFDEPTAMLDPRGKKQVFSIIRDINKKYGVTIVLVEHEMAQIAQYADRVVVLDRGRIVLDGSADQVFRQVDRLQELGLQVPQAVELGVRLREEKYLDTLPLTPDALIRQLKGRLPPGKAAQIPPEEEPDRGSPILQVRDLTVSYCGEGNQLDRVSFEIRTGDFVAIIGQNGAGKTTLARSLMGLLKPSGGSVLLEGEDIASRSVAELARTIGYVFQNPDEQIFQDSVIEELFFGPVNLGRDRDAAAPLVEEALEQIGLAPYREVWSKYLSKGERQRLAMGAVMTMDPKVFLVDEPTTGQDWRETIRVMELLAALHRKGKTVVIITHNMEIVGRYCNRALVMREGRITLDGPPRQVFAQTQLLADTWVEATDVTRIAMALDYMPDQILTVEEFLREFDHGMKGGSGHAG